VLKASAFGSDSPWSPTVVLVRADLSCFVFDRFHRTEHDKAWARSAQTALASNNAFLLRTVAWAFPMVHRADLQLLLDVYSWNSQSLLIHYATHHPALVLGLSCKSLN